jgi:hypothetical protein
MGVLVIENVLVNINSEALPFAFEIHFLDEPGKHVFTTRTENDVQQWVKTLRQSSYQYWKERYNELRRTLKSSPASIQNDVIIHYTYVNIRF